MKKTKRETKRETIMGAELRNMKPGFADVYKDGRHLGNVVRISLHAWSKGKKWFWRDANGATISNEAYRKQDEAVHEILKHHGISYRTSLPKKQKYKVVKTKLKHFPFSVYAGSEVARCWDETTAENIALLLNIKDEINKAIDSLSDSISEIRSLIDKGPA